ncbi:DUF5005 domain-containing protein [Longitalea luteola]|uniref:DUF5005 domain-containing protein n=1 Tax=Longitalea luteola TaxID=2812563 RepID=UPI001A956A45|nr:DUF5005 domain-containing protein [Longitalea luteola]
MKKRLLCRRPIWTAALLCLLLLQHCTKIDAPVNDNAAEYSGTVSVRSVIGPGTNGFYSITNVFSGHAMEVFASSTADGGPVVQYANFNFQNQKWVVKDLGSGYFSIMNGFSGKVLDVPGSTNETGRQLQQYTWNTTNAQQWRIEDVGGGAYRIINRGNGLAVTNQNNATGSGTAITQQPYTGSNAQKWIFTLDTRMTFAVNNGWVNSAQVYIDNDYNNYLTRYSGWNGGDGCVTTLLPNGSLLWSFQDSFFGEVTPNRARIDNVFVRNAGFIQVNRSLSSYQQLNPIGADGRAKTWVLVPGAANGDQDLYWGGPAQVLGNEVQMVMGHMHLNASNELEHQRTDVVVFDAASMQQKRVVHNRYTGSLPFDASLFKANDGYTYMYTTQNVGICGSRLYVARAANHNITGAWEFYSNTGWTTNQPADANLQPILEANATQPNVFYKDGKYYLVSQTTCYGLDINIWESNSPVGPFVNQRTIYRIPQQYTLPEFVTYNAVVHHALSREGELVVSYNINPTDFWSNFNNPGSADRYRPWVVRIYNWK